MKASFMLHQVLRISALALLVSQTTIQAFQSRVQPSSSYCTVKKHLSNKNQICQKSVTNLQAHNGLSDFLMSSYHQVLLADSSATYIDMNGVMTDSSTSGADPLVLVAGGVAVVALGALVFLQVENKEDDESSGGAKPKAADFSSSSAASAPVAVPSDDSSSDTMASNISEDEEKAEKARIAAVAAAMSEEMKLRPNDEFTKEEDEALTSFDQGDRVGLFGSLGRLTGKIRWTRAQLQKEQALRETSEAKLTEAAEEMINLEDQFELGQNKLAATARDLMMTRSDLTNTKKKLTTTSSNLQELKEERKSLRKLGKVAWNLSRDRVHARVRKIRGKGNEDSSD